MSEAPPVFRIESCLRLDTGRQRRNNEDYVGSFEPSNPEELARLGRLYVVADGVGGAASGEVASQHAVETVLHEYFHSDEPDLRERLRLAIDRANASIYRYAQERAGPGGLATTLVAAVVQGDRAIIANAGDSRAYLVREGRARQITQDHNLAAALVREGRLTPEAAREHRGRRQLLRALGREENIYADFFEDRLQPGDQLLLCTDGLTEYAEPQDIARLIAAPTVEACAVDMIDFANRRGGHDNIGVAVVRLSAPQPAMIAAGMAELATQRAIPVEAPRRLLGIARERWPLVTTALVLVIVVCLGLSVSLSAILTTRPTAVALVIPSPTTVSPPTLLTPPSPTLRPATSMPDVIPTVTAGTAASPRPTSPPSPSAQTTPVQTGSAEFPAATPPDYGPLVTPGPGPWCIYRVQKNDALILIERQLGLPSPWPWARWDAQRNAPILSPMPRSVIVVGDLLAFQPPPNRDCPPGTGQVGDGR